MMQKELTINVDERVYDELQRIGGPEDISQFIEALILPQLGGLNLASAYQQMAEDKDREAEALEWAEAMIGDVDEATADRKHTLEELLASVTKRNIHTEIDAGPSVGKESW